MIRRAYLNLVQVWHPDHFPKDSVIQQEAELATTCINEAYWALRPAKRARSEVLHRTPHSPRSSHVEQDPVGPTCSDGAPADWDGRRLLYTGLVIVAMVVWLAATALLFWALIVWD